MSTIVVNASALRSGGAMTIYRQFLHHLPDHIGNNQYYIFVDPTMERPVIEGVTYVNDSDHSRLHYIVWSLFGLKRWLKRHGITPFVIVSLQNVGTITRYRQIIYYHQSLPLYEKRWSFLKPDERTMAMYKYVYPYFVQSTINSNTEIVVQIPFIKRGVVKRYKCEPDKVHVLFPDIEKIERDKIVPHNFEQGLYHFVYPANAASYKEHKTIVEALVELRKNNPSLVDRIRIHLTLLPENHPALHKNIIEHNLSIQFDFAGLLPHDKLLSMYKSSTGLLYPSTIETVGLPLLEAGAFGLPVVVSDLEYAHEVVGDYEGVQYVGCYDYERWAVAIARVCDGQKRYQSMSVKRSSWKEFFSLINNK